MLDVSPSRVATAAAPMAVVVSALHARHYLPLVRLATTLVDHQASAEEVVQEAFEKVIRRWAKLRDVDAVEAYLRRCVVNGCHDRIRRRVVRRTSWPTAASVAPSAEDTAVLGDEQRRVLAAVRALPSRQREVLLLRYLAEWSETEVAAALGISKGTVKSSAHKGIAALRVALAEGVEHR